MDELAVLALVTELTGVGLGPDGDGCGEDCVVDGADGGDGGGSIGIDAVILGAEVGEAPPPPLGGVDALVDKGVV